MSPLHFACINGHDNLVEFFLQKHESIDPMHLDNFRVFIFIIFLFSMFSYTFVANTIAFSVFKWSL